MADEDQKELDYADLLDDPTAGGGGGFWEKKEGTYRAKLIRFEAGPVFENEKDRVVNGEKTKVKEKAGTLRWIFKLYRMQSGKALTYEVKEGEKAGQTVEVETDALTSRTFTKGSNAGKWLRILLGRDLDWTAMLDASPAEQAAIKRALMKEAEGKWAAASFGTSKTSDKIALRELSKLDLEEDDN